MPRPTSIADPRIRLVRRLRPGLRLAALADALTVCSPREAPALATELVELAVTPPRKDPPGWARIPPIEGIFDAVHRAGVVRADRALAALARHWADLPDELRGPAAAVGAGRWGDALNPDTPPLCLAELARDTDDVSLAPALVGALGSDGAGALAIDTLADFARRAHDDLARARAGGTTAGGWRPVAIALIHAAADYARHNCREALAGVLLVLEGPGRRLLPRREHDTLLSIVRDPGHPAAKGIRGELRWSRSPVVRARAWSWLADDAFAAASLDRLSRAPTIADHDAVLASSHLVLNPRRRRRLRMIDLRPSTHRAPDKPAAIDLPEGAGVPTVAQYPRLGAPARRGLGRMLAAASVSPELRRALLAPAVADPDAHARFASARVLDTADLADFAFDADPLVARHAVLRRSRPSVAVSGEARARLAHELGKLIRSPHPSVRALAAQDAHRLDPWDGGSSASRLAARFALARDADAFIAEVRTRLLGADEDASLGAIQLARRLGLVGRLRDELVLLALDASRPDRVVATAVGALGSDDAESSRDAIARAIDHGDTRVRANAVEALAKRTRRLPDLAAGDPRAYSVLVEHKDDAEHRVRANAIVGLLRPRRARALAERKPSPRLFEPAATDALRSMLGDARPMHRLAGLWAAERLLPAASLGDSAAAVLAEVGRLRADEDPRVRRRADRCRARLVAARVEEPS